MCIQHVAIAYGVGRLKLGGTGDCSCVVWLANENGTSVSSAPELCQWWFIRVWEKQMSLNISEHNMKHYEKCLWTALKFVHDLYWSFSPTLQGSKILRRAKINFYGALALILVTGGCVMCLVCIAISSFPFLQVEEKDPWIET